MLWHHQIPRHEIRNIFYRITQSCNEICLVYVQARRNDKNSGGLGVYQKNGPTWLANYEDRSIKSFKMLRKT